MKVFILAFLIIFSLFSSGSPFIFSSGFRLVKSIYNTVKTTSSNLFVDNLLLNARLVMRLKGLDKVKLPDIDYDSGWYTSFKATDGELRSLRSIERFGDSTSEYTGETLSLSFNTTFKEFSVSYNNYELSLFGFKLNGKMSMDVKSNIAQMSMGLLDKDCIVNIREVKIAVLDGVETQFTGLGSYQETYEKALDTIISYLTNFIKETVGDKIKDSLNKSLQGSHLMCNTLMRG